MSKPYCPALVGSQVSENKLIVPDKDVTDHRDDRILDVLALRGCFMLIFRLA